MAQATESRSAERHAFITGFHGLPYQVKDVARAVAFYTQNLGLKLEHQHLPEIASVSVGDAQILLSGPGASGSRANADWTAPRAGRLESGRPERLRFARIHRCIEESRASVSHRHGDRSGWSTNQIEDPNGNPIELFEPTRTEQMKQFGDRTSADRDRTGS
jgi:glyoxylase I family protein